MKTCSKCKAEKPLTEFYLQTQRSGNKHPGSYCKPCSKTDFTGRRSGVDSELREAMFVAQNGRCAVCKTDSPGGHGAFHVDHDHACCPGRRSCGKCVRALLCCNCNLGIGFLGDDVTRLNNASLYLSLHSRAQ